MRDIVHHQSPTSDPFLLLPVRDFEGVGGGVTAFQTTVRDDNREGNAEERFVMTKRTARARRLFRSRKAASLRLGLRKSRKVRLLVVIVGVQRCQRQPDPGSDARMDALSDGIFCLLNDAHARLFSPRGQRWHDERMTGYGGTMVGRVQFKGEHQRL